MNHSHSFYFLLPLDMVKTPDITASKCLTAGIWISSVFSVAVHDIVGHIQSFEVLDTLDLRIRTGGIIMDLLIMLELIIKINHQGEKILQLL